MPKWKDLHRAADGRLKDSIGVISKALRDLSQPGEFEYYDLRDLRMVAHQNIIDIFNDLEPKMREIYRDISEKAGHVAARHFRVSKAKDDFEPATREQAEEAHVKTAAVIALLTAQATNRLSDIINRGIAKGWPVEDIAREIRNNGLGMSVQQGRVYDKLDEFRRTATPKELANPPAWVKGKLRNAGTYSQWQRGRRWSAIQGYKKWAIKDRSMTIARTEGTRAYIGGQRAYHRQLMGKGILDDRYHRMMWIVTWDDRLCDRCSQMAGQVRKLNGVYSNGTDGPPLHPRCRCDEELYTIPVSQRGSLVP